MIKQKIQLIILVLLVIVGVVWLQNHSGSPEEARSGVHIATWNSSMGAVDNGANFDVQRLSFSANIWNDSKESSYITVIAD